MVEINLSMLIIIHTHFWATPLMNPLELSDPGTCKGFLHLGEGIPATDFKYTSNIFPFK